MGKLSTAEEIQILKNRITELENRGPISPERMIAQEVARKAVRETVDKALDPLHVAAEAFKATRPTKAPAMSKEDRLRVEALKERRIRLEDIQADFETTGKIPLESLVRIASDIASINGFHDPDNHPPGIAGIPHMIGLNVSEFGEIIERSRKNPTAIDEHVPGRTNLEVECADVVIRLLDMIGHCDAMALLDEPVERRALTAHGFAAALLEKMIANSKRPLRHGKDR